MAAKKIQKARERDWADDERWHRRKVGIRFLANGVVTYPRDNDGNVMGYSKISLLRCKLG